MYGGVVNMGLLTETSKEKINEISSFFDVGEERESRRQSINLRSEERKSLYLELLFLSG